MYRLFPVMVLLVFFSFSSEKVQAGGCTFSDSHFVGLGTFEADTIGGCLEAVREAFDVHADLINYANRDKWCAHSCTGGTSTYCHFKAVQNCEVGRNPDQIGAVYFDPNWQLPEPEEPDCAGGYDYDPFASGCVQVCTEGGACEEVCPESACTCSDGFAPYFDIFDPSSGTNWNYCDRLPITNNCPGAFEELLVGSSAEAYCSTENIPDTDGDGVHDLADNCPEIAQEYQYDFDKDGIGKACDDYEMDFDGDGIDDRDDECPYNVNSGNDFNHNGIDDACDIDSDGDGITDDIDTDDDNDGIEDTFDTDDNGDGLADWDTDGDGTADYYDNDDDGDGVLDYYDVDPDGDGTRNGAGDCDPTANNYYECAGLIEGDANLPDIDQINNDLTGNLDDLETTLLADINSVTGSGIPSPDGLTSTVSGLLVNGTSCSPYTLNFPDHALVLECDRFDWFKNYAGWALYLYTAWSVFFIAIRPVPG